MHNKSGKSPKTVALKRKKRRSSLQLSAALFAQAAYDPELLYVECGHCGAPVLWEPGRATELLAKAGVDPVELDASCILVTDACPACGHGHEFTVRIFRVSDSPSDLNPKPCGHA